MVETNKKQTQREKQTKTNKKQTGRLSFFAKWRLNFRGLFTKHKPKTKEDALSYMKKSNTQV